jgi:hypothetical protein
MKNDRQSQEISRVLLDIITYLLDHPDASDTAEGIMQWWLLEQRILQQMPIIEKALAELGQRGFVIEHKGIDGQIHYRINQRKLNQIKKFLSKKRNYSY